MAPLVIILRPEPGCAATVAAAHAMGLEAQGFPLFVAAPLAWEAPDPASFDALLIGSANAPRHAGAALTGFADKPAYAVGAATAAACVDAGLAVAGVADGGLQAALSMLHPGHRRLLRLAGQERVELTPPAGVTIIERVVYASNPLALPGPLALLVTARALPEIVVVLHSAAAARHFAAEFDRLALPRARIKIAALAPRIAEAAGPGWAEVRTAGEVSDAALLALAAAMCQAQATKESSLPMPDQPPTDELHADPDAASARPWMLRLTVALVLLALIAGGGWAAWQRRTAWLPAPGALTAIGDPAAAARISSLEARLSRIDQQASAAEGNAARAEALLVAFAARRAVDRGVPLGYLEGQLRLRFGVALPGAVALVTAASQAPITRDQLDAQLQAMGPRLIAAPPNESSWQRLGRAFSGLFVIRRDSSPGPAPEARLSNALLCLHEGRIDAAVADMQRLPPSPELNHWIVAARHYSDVQRALDLLETTALLEPRMLRDAGGRAVTPPPPTSPSNSL